jgi:hypothetical protein
LRNFISSNNFSKWERVVEAFCESNNISSSDGFTPYWDPEHFEDKKVNIFI